MLFLDYSVSIHMFALKHKIMNSTSSGSSGSAATGGGGGKEDGKEQQLFSRSRIVLQDNALNLNARNDALEISDIVDDEEDSFESLLFSMPLLDHSRSISETSFYSLG